MNTLYVLVGLSGSGKSTWAKNNLGIKFNKILSSDEYRERLFGDINDQTHNDVVFNTLYKDLVNDLLNNQDICFDATSINRKSRKKLFDNIKYIKDTNKIAVVFATPIDIVKYNNSNRSRVVPEFVIDRQLRQFEIPFIEEGFNSVEIVDYLPIEESTITVMNIIHDMNGFNQNNPHHTLTLNEHCEKCCKLLWEENELTNELTSAARIHDLGKLYTKTTDNKGISHYYNHENVGAYNSLFINYTYNGLLLDRHKVAFYINYHMEPFKLNGMKKENCERLIKSFGKEWDNLLKLHKCDLLAK